MQLEMSLPQKIQLLMVLNTSMMEILKNLQVLFKKMISNKLSRLIIKRKIKTMEDKTDKVAEEEVEETVKEEASRSKASKEKVTRDKKDLLEEALRRIITKEVEIVSKTKFMRTMRQNKTMVKKVKKVIK